MGEKPVRSINTAEYDALIEVVREARLNAGLGIPALSKRLGQAPMFIYKVESKGRRLDVTEFRSIAMALGIPPEEFFQRWLKRLDEIHIIDNRTV